MVILFNEGELLIEVDTFPARLLPVLVLSGLMCHRPRAAQAVSGNSSRRPPRLRTPPLNIIMG